MSGDLIWVRGDHGRMVQTRDLPDVCGNGHQGQVWIQHSWCPQCNRPCYVFRCQMTACRWVAAVQDHYDRECTPDAPVYLPQPRGAAG